MGASYYLSANVKAPNRNAVRKIIEAAGEAFPKPFARVENDETSIEVRGYSKNYNLVAEGFAKKCAALGCEGGLILEGEGEYESLNEIEISPGKYSVIEYERVWKPGNKATHEVPLESIKPAKMRKTTTPGMQGG